MTTMTGGSASILRATSHRPWPLPRTPWAMRQRWEDLLFAHWPMPIGALRPLVPEPLVVEEHGGTAWIGITPFRITRSRLRMLPPIPGADRFLEVNLRTYVRFGDRPGVFFFSLDVSSRLVVLGARVGYRLPYFSATMDAGRRSDGGLAFRSRRAGGGAELRVRYGPHGSPFRPEPGTIEHFLTERYALYAVLRSGRVLRGDIHHLPWVLRPAGVDVEHNNLAAAVGIDLPHRPELVHYASRQDTLIWPPTALR
jgi:uncharacterized protein